MLIDFNTGLAMFTKTSEPRPPAQQLQMTSKGHYVLNLATYLTGGRESPGHPQVVVRRKATDNPDVDYRFLELGTVYFDMSASDHVMPTMTAVSSDVVSESLANMYWLLDQSRQCVSNVATATSAQMTGPSPTTTPATSPSRSPQGHVEPRRADHQRGNLRGRDQAEDSQGKGQSHATGLHPTGEGGQPRFPVHPAVSGRATTATSRTTRRPMLTVAGPTAACAIYAWSTSPVRGATDRPRRARTPQWSSGC